MAELFVTQRRELVLAAGLAFLLSCLGSQGALAQGELPESIFWDGFETGDLLHWEGVEIPGGGSIEFPPGSLAPNTDVEIQPVSTPPLPNAFEPFGQAFQITIEPSLLLPAELSLPLPPGEDPAGAWIIEVDSAGGVIVLESEFTPAGIVVSHDNEVGGSSAGVLLTQALFSYDSKELFEITYQLSRIFDERLPRITFSDAVPSDRARVGEPVIATVAWEGEPNEIEFNWNDGSEDVKPVNSSISDTSKLHVYQELGRRIIRILAARHDSPQGDSVASLRVISVYGGVAGFWNSSFGGITFVDEGGGTYEGTFLPSQNGAIYGFTTGDGRTLTGTWVETQSIAKCTTTMPDSTGAPSNHWGRLEFVFDENFTHFCGLWDYCNEAPDELVWKGWAPGFSSPTCP